MKQIIFGIKSLILALTLISEAIIGGALTTSSGAYSDPEPTEVSFTQKDLREYAVNAYNAMTWKTIITDLNDVHCDDPQAVDRAYCYGIIGARFITPDHGITCLLLEPYPALGEHSRYSIYCLRLATAVTSPPPQSPSLPHNEQHVCALFSINGTALGIESAEQKAIDDQNCTQIMYPPYYRDAAFYPLIELPTRTKIIYRYPFGTGTCATIKDDEVTCIMTNGHQSHYFKLSVNTISLG